MSTYKIHEPLSFISLLVIIAILQFYKVPFELIQLLGSWIFGTLYLSPDLDANYSMPKNRIGVLKYIFVSFKHRGIMHSPLTWGFLCYVCFYFGYGWIGAGLLGAALSHIIIDWV
jgi:uncharacterized metal-binding protein